MDQRCWRFSEGYLNDFSNKLRIFSEWDCIFFHIAWNGLYGCQWYRSHCKTAILVQNAVAFKNNRTVSTVLIKHYLVALIINFNPIWHSTDGLGTYLLLAFLFTNDTTTNGEIEFNSHFLHENLFGSRVIKINQYPMMQTHFLWIMINLLFHFFHCFTAAAKICVFWGIVICIAFYVIRTGPSHHGYRILSD